MKIGIDGSRAFLKNRTGIEEYSYQIIKNLRDYLNDHRVVLYLRINQKVDFKLPKNWEIKFINWHSFWTQVGLSLEMFFYPVEVLFVPAHTIPLIHPAKTIVTIHGLEYEFCPKAYRFWAIISMKFFIKNSCKWASGIVAVSGNTKKDLIDLYKIPKDKIKVIYEGYDRDKSHNFQFPTINFQINPKSKIQNTKFLLFIGRIEERKNIINIIESFGILKEKYKIPHKLVLVGKRGYGYEKIKFKISNFKFKEEIFELGFVSEQEKWQLLKDADIFVFPTQYEGFGIPILEAQSMGCPVIASNNSCILEITHIDIKSSNHQMANFKDNKCSAVLVDPNSSKEISQAIYSVLSNETFKNDIIVRGLNNVKRFSWQLCAKKIAKILLQ